jgi:hypothetical protein
MGRLTTGNEVSTRAVALAFGSVLGLLPIPAQAQGVSEEGVMQLRRLMEQQAAMLRQQQAELARMQARLNQLEAQRVGSPPPRSAQTAQSVPGGAGAGGSPTAPQPADRPAESIVRSASAPQQQVATGSPSGAPRSAINPQSVEQQPGRRGAPQNEAQPPVSRSAEGQPALPVLSNEERVRVTLSGQVNRTLLFHNDGSGKVDTYFADNDVSSTRLRALGAASIDNDLDLISVIEFDLRSNSSSSVGRTTSNNNGGDTPVLGPFRIRRAEIGARSERLGTVLFGRGSTFSDGIANLDLSGTDVVVFSNAASSYGGLQFSNRRSPSRRSGDPSVGDVFDNLEGPRDDRLRYDSPSYRGLVFGGSVGQGGFWDVGARYSAEINGIKTVAGVAYQNLSNTLPSRNNPEDGRQPPIAPYSQALGGSVAFLLPSGFNALVAAGWAKHRGDCCGGGLPVNNDITNWYTKLGYQARIFDFASTNFSVNAGQTRNRVADGDVATRVGFQVSQPVIADALELFGAYERVMLHRSGASFNPSDIVILGSRLQF